MAINGRPMGAYLGEHSLAFTGNRKGFGVKGNLTGRRIRVKRPHHRGGILGVLQNRYMNGPGYYAKLEDGVESVVRPSEWELL